MTPTRAPLPLAAFALAALIAPGAGAQMVEAPLYTNWSRFPVGTAVTHRTVTEGPGGGAIASTTTQTLRSVDEKQAVVEQVYVEEAGGAPAEPLSQVIRHRRWFPLLPGVKREDLGRPAGASASGQERLELGGRAFEATWYDTKGQSEAGPLLTRTWYSDEVPGRILRAVTRVEGKESTTTIELVSIARP